MIKLTQLLYDLKDETQQRLDDMSLAYSEAVQYSENMNIERPKPPLPVKLKNKDYHILEKTYYLNLEPLEDISSDIEDVTILNVAGRAVFVKETVEEVYKLVQEKDDKRTL